MKRIGFILLWLGLLLNAFCNPSSGGAVLVEGGGVGSISTDNGDQGGIGRIPGIQATMPANQTVVDHRSLEEIRAAACMGADGKWRCKNIKQPVVLAMGTTPIIPVSWTVPNWFLDIASGNDGNDGITSSTPIKHKSALAQRFGTWSPTFSTAIIMTYLSADTDTSDPGQFAPIFIGTGTLLETAALPTPSFTGTLNVVTAKNVAGNQELETTFTTTTGAIAANMLLVKFDTPFKSTHKEKYSRVYMADLSTDRALYTFYDSEFGRGKYVG